MVAGVCLITALSAPVVLSNMLSYQMMKSRDTCEPYAKGTSVAAWALDAVFFEPGRTVYFRRNYNE